MNLFQIVFSAIFGLLLGSFLNVCIYRIPRDLSVVAPRSFCPECGSRIAWFDNIPVISFVQLRGKCRICSARIAWRYPIVELLTAVLFAVVAARYGWTLAGFKWALFEALLMILFWTDFNDRILPDEFTIGGSVLGLVLAWFIRVPGGIIDLLLPSVPVPVHSLIAAVFSATLFSLPFWLLGYLYEKFRQPDAFGLGDVKLLAMLGVFLGWGPGVLAISAAAVTGAAFGVAYALITRQSMRTTSLPFGAFLCLGSALAPLLSR